MKKHFTILIFTLFIFSCTQEPPEIITIESSYLPSSDSVLIAKPNNYDANKNYPLVILLHGWSGNFKQWNTIVNLKDFSNAYNFIIACPDGFYDSWYTNNVLIPQMQYEDFFWNDFIPYLTNKYSVDTSNIFITGLSMGGHGAISLFLKNPNFFKSAGSTSGILDLTHFTDNWGIKDGLGTYQDSPEIWKNNSAYYLINSIKNSGKKMIIDCGTEDFAYEVNLNFVKRCFELDIDVKFYSVPGDHNHNYWGKMIPNHFNFFYKQL